MANVQGLFERIQEAKRKQREIKAAYKDALATSVPYQQALTKWQEIRDTKKRIEQSIKGEFRAEWDQLERLQLDVKGDTELLSDAALNQLVRGETVRVTDEDAHEYEPVFTVRFRKLK